jgi:hypothetical protein
VSAAQFVPIILVIVAFAGGWLAAERRARSGRPPVLSRDGTAVVDETIAGALTAYQAVLGVWQSGANWSPVLARALNTFEQRRAAAARLEIDGEAQPEARAALERAQEALSRLDRGLEPLRQGAALSHDHERAMAGVERRLAAARTALILANGGGG